MTTTMMRRTVRRRRRRAVVGGSSSPFSAADFQSNDGMITGTWGPALWHVLHTISFNYPVNPTAEQRRQYRDFVLSLRNVLPCGKCRENLRRNLRETLPLRASHLRSREDFARYVFELHETVNRMLDKPASDPPRTFEQIREKYEHLRARCAASPPPPSSSSELGCQQPAHAARAKPHCLVSLRPESELRGRRDHITLDASCLAQKA